MSLLKTMRRVVLVLCEKTMQTSSHWVANYLLNLISWLWLFQDDLFLILFILLLNFLSLFVTVIYEFRIFIMLVPLYRFLFDNLSFFCWLQKWWVDHFTAVALLIFLLLFLLIDPFQKMFRVHINLLQHPFDVIWWLLNYPSVQLWHFYLVHAPHLIRPRKHLIVIVTWHRPVIIHDFLQVNFFHILFFNSWIQTFFIIVSLREIWTVEYPWRGNYFFCLGAISPGWILNRFGDLGQFVFGLLKVQSFGIGWLHLFKIILN